MLGLRCCVKGFPEVWQAGVAFRGGAWPSHPAAARGRRASGGCAGSVAAARGGGAPESALSNRGTRPWLLRGTLDLPGPGINPVSPALAGRFLTTTQPGKPLFSFLNEVRREHMGSGAEGKLCLDA